MVMLYKECSRHIIATNKTYCSLKDNYGKQVLEHTLCIDTHFYQYQVPLVNRKGESRSYRQHDYTHF